MEKETKKCNCCGQVKPLEEFYLLRKDRPWRRSKCIPCHQARDKENRQIRLTK